MSDLIPDENSNIKNKNNNNNNNNNDNNMKSIKITVNNLKSHKYDGQRSRRKEKEGLGTYFYGNIKRINYYYYYINTIININIIIKENGDSYNGEWKNNKKHGKGTYTYANGDVFTVLTTTITITVKTLY